MTHIYEPPTLDLVPPIYLEPDPYYPVPAVAQRLFRHYKNRARGRQAYILNDNTITETQPYDNANVRTIVYAGHLNVLSDLDYELITAYFAGGTPGSGTWGDLVLLKWSDIAADTWLTVST